MSPAHGMHVLGLLRHLMYLSSISSGLESNQASCEPTNVGSDRRAGVHGIDGRLPFRVRPAAEAAGRSARSARSARAARAARAGHGEKIGEFHVHNVVEVCCLFAFAATVPFAQCHKTENSKHGARCGRANNTIKTSMSERSLPSPPQGCLG